mmetsp:Transcript_21568/g.54847  ORF Transcript_21568/g.54847 Transcript_21568/m.54847 type:complete len:134 (+) Transcript_21568:421-822(+)
MLCAPSATLRRSAWWKGLLYGTPETEGKPGDDERRRSVSLDRKASREGARARGDRARAGDPLCCRRSGGISSGGEPPGVISSGGEWLRLAGAISWAELIRRDSARSLRPSAVEGFVEGVGRLASVEVLAQLLR